MRIAIVHDYLREFGGAERVLKTLSEMYPDASIYTAFRVRGSTADKEFKDRKIVESWLAPILKIGKLYSPLRFLTPLVWRSFDLSKYDLVITSCSWYISRGFKVSPKTKVIAYCHTPPRWLYGYETSVGFTKYWPVRIYAAIVGHFIRIYDFRTAQPINHWIANSKNVQARIKKFYRKESVVVYPPVEVEEVTRTTNRLSDSKEKDYFLIVSRLVGAKGLEEAVKAFRPKEDQSVAGKSLTYKLKIVGEAHGFSNLKSQISNLKSSNIKLIGRVDDVELWKLYRGARGFIALAKDEDFGMTVVEAQAAGTPVIAFNGGGFRESVIDGVTGILINDTDERTIRTTIERFNKMKWDKRVLQKQARRFSRDIFEREIRKVVSF